MSQPSLMPGTPETRAAFLLQEASGLRSEITGHQAARYNVDQFGLAAVIAVYAWAIGVDNVNPAFFWLPPVLALAAALRQRTIYRAITKIAAYVAETEQELAGGGWECWLKSRQEKKHISALSHWIWAIVTVATTIIAVAETAGRPLLSHLTGTAPST